MTYGIALIIVGALVAVGSVIYALFNMGRQAKRIFGGNFDQALSGYGGAFARHLGAMAGLVIGGFVTFVGIALLYFGY